MSKSDERLVEELRENSVSRQWEESSTSKGSVLKLKRKMEEVQGAIEKGTQEQALKWATYYKYEATERGQTP